MRADAGHQQQVRIALISIALCVAGVVAITIASLPARYFREEGESDRSGSLAATGLEWTSGNADFDALANANLSLRISNAHLLNTETQYTEVIPQFMESHERSPDLAKSLTERNGSDGWKLSTPYEIGPIAYDGTLRFVVELLQDGKPVDSTSPLEVFDHGRYIQLSSGHGSSVATYEKECTDHYQGIYEAGLCFVFGILSGMCFQVERDATGTFQFPHAMSYIGCELNKFGHGSPAYYRPLAGEQGGTTSHPTEEMVTVSASIMLMSSMDPFVVAEKARLAQGSAQFPDEYAWASFVMIAGICCLLFGLVSGAVPLLFFCCNGLQLLDHGSRDERLEVYSVLQIGVEPEVTGHGHGRGRKSGNRMRASTLLGAV